MQRRGSHRLWALAIIGAGAAVHAPELRSGLAADDFLQRAMLNHAYPVARSPLNLFSFESPGDLKSLLAQGTFPWWVDPKLKMMALRPLASALTALDVRVLQLSQFAQHLHSLLWFVALLAAFAGVLFARLAPRTALLALAVYAVDPALVLPVGWLANRNALITTTFALAGLWAHMRWRERKDRRYGPVAALAFALALLSGEYALCAFGYLIAYELFAAPGALGDRLKALLPAGALSVAYLATYAGLGYGASGSSVYLDPRSRPGAFLSHAVVRYPALIANELFTIPGNAARQALMATPLSLLVLVPALVAVAALVPGAVRRLEHRERQVVVAWVAGSLLSLLPLVGTLPSPRLLVVPALGGSVILAVLLRDAWARLSGLKRAREVGVWARGAVVGLLGTMHLLLAPFSTLAGSINWARTQAWSRNLYRHAQIDDAKVAHQTVVLLNCFDPVTLVYPPYVRRMYGSPLPRAWRALTMTVSSERVLRTTPDTLELVAQRGGALLQAASAGLYRSTLSPLRAGQVVRIAGLDVEVLEMDGWGPRRVRFHFDRDLDDPSFVFLIMTKRGLTRFSLPRVGHAALVPGASDLGRPTAKTPRVHR